MSVRRRAMALIGARTDTDPIADRFVEPPRRVYEQDAEERHQTVGKHWQVDAQELLLLAQEMRAELSGIDKPAGFEPIAFEVVVEVVRELAKIRPDTDMPLPELSFRWNGTRIPVDANFFSDRANDLRPGTFFSVTPTPFDPNYPRYAPNTPASQLRADGLAESRRCQFEDARKVAAVFVGPLERHRSGLLRRVWLPGTAFPEPLEGEAELLPASVVRRVMREVRDACEYPSPRTQDAPFLFYEIDLEGDRVTCYGPNHPTIVERHWGRDPAEFLRVPLPLDSHGRVTDDPEACEALEGQVALVRRYPSGRLELPPTWPWG